MKFLFSTGYNQSHLNIALLLVRLAIGGFMLSHGIPKLMKFFSDQPITFADPLGVGVMPSLLMAVFSEVVCSILIMLGLCTRLAAIPLIITMVVAVGIVHMTDPFGKKELGLLYISVYVMLFVLGSGKYSLDNMIFNKTSKGSII